MSDIQSQDPTVLLDKVVGGGQTIGTLEDGRKVFVWGGLPGELVRLRITKRKSKLSEAFVNEVIEPSPMRVPAKDQESYLSTSPWQIYDFKAEQNYKAALIEEAFELHDVILPDPITIGTDGVEYGYRNKVEFSFWWDNERSEIDLAFFQRGSHGKIPVDGTALANPAINTAAIQIRDILRRSNVEARHFKTLLIRSNQKGAVSAQLYIKDKHIERHINPSALRDLGFPIEIIQSDYRSPASVITERLSSYSDPTLTDQILDVSFNYSVESFFQVNLPVYEKALGDMERFVEPDKPLVDMYSGVGTIGLTIGKSSKTTLVESNQYAVEQMRRNISDTKSTATVIHASSEKALDCIQPNSTVIVDPPRAGLHGAVIDRLLEVQPPRILYLSCNPTTQARDIALLLKSYSIKFHRGYNFFPHTPHIEHLVVLEPKK